MPSLENWGGGLKILCIRVPVSCSTLCVLCVVCCMFWRNVWIVEVRFLGFFLLLILLLGWCAIHMYVYHSPPRFLNASIDMQRKAELEGEIKVRVHWNNWRGVLLILLMHVPSPSLHPTGCSEVSECV